MSGLGLASWLSWTWLGCLSLPHADHELFSFALCSSCFLGPTTSSLSRELGSDVQWWEAAGGVGVLVLIIGCSLAKNKEEGKKTPISGLRYQHGGMKSPWEVGLRPGFELINFPVVSPQTGASNLCNSVSNLVREENLRISFYTSLCCGRNMMSWSFECLCALCPPENSY